MFGISENVIKVDNPEYFSTVFDEKATVIIPGGQTIFAATELDKVKSVLKDKIYNGWNYLGICCGASLACRKITVDYDRGDSEKVRVVYNGGEFGILGLLNIDIEMKSTLTEIPEIAPIKLDDKNFDVYWQAGGKFIIPKEESANYKIIARYRNENEDPAIIFGKYGKGRVVVSCVHPEIDSTSLFRYLYFQKKEKDYFKIENILALQKSNNDEILEKIFSQLEILKKDNSVAI